MVVAKRNVELGEFLRSRRSSALPFPATGGNTRRQVPGLRREEVAVAANISTSYYVSLEQGRGGAVSPHVIDRLAAVLRLDAHEREHLRVIARPGSSDALATVADAGGDGVDATLATMLAAMSDLPAVVSTIEGDVLRSNPLADAVFAPLADGRPGPELPNIARSVFRGPSARGFFRNWSEKAEAVAAHLRFGLGRDPRNDRLRGLIKELSESGHDFARIWAKGAVAPCAPMRLTLDHPVVGRLDFMQRSVVPTDGRRQQLTVLHPEPGGATTKALSRLLAA